LFKTKPKIISRANVKPENLALIKTGLNSLVNDVGGTAYRLSTRERLFSGKTGTAQVIARTSKEDLFKKCMSKDLEKRHHGWFVGYGPGENPEIVVAVLLLHGCLSRNAAIVAGKVLNKWMEIRDQDQLIYIQYQILLIIV